MSIDKTQKLAQKALKMLDQLEADTAAAAATVSALFIEATEPSVKSDRIERLFKAEIEHTKELRSQLRAANSMIANLERRLFVPGHYECPKCDFYVISTRFNLTEGTTEPDRDTEECWNGCGPMARVTHEQNAATCSKRLEKEIEVTNALRNELIEWGGGMVTCLVCHSGNHGGEPILHDKNCIMDGYTKDSAYGPAIRKVTS